MERKIELRNFNIDPSDTYFDEKKLATLDGSLKKTQTFVRKLKCVTTEQLPSLKQEFGKLKLSKYIGESISALLENRPKSSNDMLAFLEICTLFNLHYPEFASELYNQMFKLVSIDKNMTDDKVVEEISKKRIVLRMYGEMYLVALIPDLQPLLDAFKAIFSLEEDKTSKFLPIVNYFLKHLKDIFLTGSEHIVSSEWCGRFSELFSGICKNHCRMLVRSHTRLQGIESRGKHHYENKGDLTDRQTAAWLDAKELVSSLQTNLQVLCDHLGVPLPALQENKAAPIISDGKIVFADLSMKKAGQSDNSIYDTDEDRAFYESLISLKDLVPVDVLPALQEVAEDENLTTFDVPDVDPEKTNTTADKLIQDSASSKEVNSFDSFLNSLQNMHTAAMADKAAADFCFVVSKSQRKALPDILIEMTRNRSDLMPFIGRFLATLKPFFPEICALVSDSLLGQFFFLSRIKEPIRATRARICRFIGELTKFRVMSQGKTFACLKRAVDDFVLYNIDMACLLLETCGRFLLNQPESHARIEGLREIILRKKKSGTLDQNRVVLIENALFLLNPPQLPAQTVKKTKGLLEEYIIYLVRVKLTPSNAENIFNELRKLPWGHAETQRILLKVLMKGWKLKDSLIPSVASIIAGIGRIHPDFLTKFLDQLFEEFVLGMERNLNSWSQRRIAVVKLIGELYASNVIDADLIVDVLSLLLSFGHPFGLPRTTVTSGLDSTCDLFRIRLVCTLLHTVGEYFREGPLKPVLERFLIAFQYYVCTKCPITLEVENLLEETFEFLRQEIRFDTPETAIPALVATGHGALDFLLEDIHGGIRSHPAESVDLEQSTVVIPEDDLEDFDRQLSSMIGESMESRKLDKKPPQFDFSVPLSVLNAPKPISEDRISFKLMLKKKNKPLTKELDIPLNPAFIEQIQEERRVLSSEQEKLRQRALDCHENSGDAPGVTNVLLTALKQIPPPSRTDLRKAAAAPQRRRFYRNIKPQ